MNIKMNMTKEEIALEIVHVGLDTSVRYIHSQAVQVGWWTGVDPHANLPRSLCLIHSEISEALEGHRKGIRDDKLPHRWSYEVELADAVIRIFDLAGALDIDLPGAIVEKIKYNRTREDHKPENRAKPGGKKY